MRLSARLPLFVMLWFLAEFIAFGLIAGAIGFGGALILCLLTSLAGVAMLRRLGLSTAWRLRRAMFARSQEEAGLSREAVLDGGLIAAGSLLLILPGFISDFCGLALAAPSIRARIAERFRRGATAQRGGGRSAPPLLELDPREWSRTDQAGGPRAPGKLGSTKVP